MCYSKVKSEQCSECDGTGKVPMQRCEGTLVKCIDCNGWGYRVIYRNDDGYERSVSVDHHRSGIISVYFDNCG